MKLSGASVVSRTIRRSAAVRRKRRGRVSGKDISAEPTRSHLGLFAARGGLDSLGEAMRNLRRSAVVTVLMVAPIVGVVAAADSKAAIVVGEGGVIMSAPAASSATVVRLSRLHHVATREVELGRLAQLSASRAETRAYGARLVTDFQEFDERIA